MTTFAVDPFLLAIPTTTNRDECAAWLTALVGWLEEVRVGDLDWRHLSRCTTSLLQLGRLVNFSAMQRLVRWTEVDVNVGDIARRLNGFLQNAEYDLETRAAANEVLVDKVQVTPEEVRARLSVIDSEFVDEVCRLVHTDVEAGTSTWFVLAPPTAPVGTVEVDFELHDVTPAGTPVPRRLSGRFAALTSPSQLGSVEEIRRRARERPDYLAAAIRRVCLSQSGRSGNVSIGAAFMPSLSASSILQSPGGVDRVVRVAAAIGSGDIAPGLRLRPVRVSAAADAAQLVRRSDSAKAWRVTLNPAGVGWRLHFWRTSQDAIELASVAKKGDPVCVPE